jgi:hypothetical protein
MINNTKRTAEFKLSKHRTDGERTSLSIFEVANLMDMIRRSEEMSTGIVQPNIFHSIAYN